MKRINLLLFTLIVILQSCNNDDNCDQDCFTPPNTFLFEVMDKTSGENLFTNETYNPEDIIITDSLNDNQSVAYTFISEENLNLIQIWSIGWETEIVNLNINVSEDHIFDLYVDVERKSENCCSFSQYNEIRVSNSELDTQTGIYKILVE